MLIVQYLGIFVDVNIAAVSTTNNAIVRECMEDGGYVRLKQYFILKTFQTLYRIHPIHQISINRVNTFEALHSV